MSKKRIPKTMLLVTGLVCLVAVGAVSYRYYNGYRFHLEKQTRFMMDTLVTIYVVAPRDQAVQAMRDAFERMQAVDDKFNTLNPVGAVYAFNHNNTPITDPEIISVVQKALEVAQGTGGAFDITIEPLIELWGFYGDTPELPEADAVAASLQNTGYRSLHISNGTLTKDRPDIRIDLGGIAKGYAIRAAARALTERGITSALIDAGGDVYALGRRGGDLWKVGIRDPRGEDLIGMVEVEDVSVMGSGDYHRFFMQNGKRYHHIFDPATGYPARGVRSTTLIHADPMIADAWNTAIFVMGPEKGLALVEKIPDMEAMMVTDTGQILCTSGLSRSLQVNAQAVESKKNGLASNQAQGGTHE